MTDKSVNNLVDKVVYHDFSDLEGNNAHIIIAAFELQAKAQGWNSHELNLVKDQLMSGDYDHLWMVMRHYSKTRNP